MSQAERLGAAELAGPPMPGNRHPLATSIADAAEISGVGKSTLYEAMVGGKLKYLKVGRRRLILVDDLRAWLETYRAA
jgi:excisionase family DNA binding protein